MGLDWIPCRVEPRGDIQHVEHAVDQEFRRFAQYSGYVETQLMPLLDRDPYREYEPPADNQHPPFDVSDFLLVKYRESHRVYVISELEILPLEWRLDAYRTLLPHQLADVFQKWSRYLTAVAAGHHRAYLEEILVYLSTIKTGHLVVDAMRAAEVSEDSTASWAQRSEVAAVREEILNFPRPKTPTIPRFRPDFSPSVDFRSRRDSLNDYRAEFARLVGNWNATTRRGNWRLDAPPETPDLESWISGWLKNKWFSKFTQWIEPWIDGGYGLYREE